METSTSLKSGVYLCVCVSKNVSVFVYVCCCLYGCMYWHSSLHIYLYFCCLLMGREWDDGRECEKGKVSEVGGGGMDCCNQNIYIYIYIHTHTLIYHMRDLGIKILWS